MQTPEQVAQANIDAYNAHDVAALIATFTPSATFGQLGGRILLDGRGSMQGYYTQLFAARPTVRCEVKQRTVMGPFVVELQEISGDDQPGMQAMLISEVCEEKIVKVWYSPLAGGPPAH
jgi:hypothetical protein